MQRREVGDVVEDAGEDEVVDQRVDWGPRHDEHGGGNEVGEVVYVVGACEAHGESGDHEEGGPGEEKGGSP